MTFALGESGPDGRGHPAVPDSETAPSELLPRSVDEIFAGLQKLNGLHCEDEVLTERFMRGEMNALLSFLVPAAGWPVLTDEAGLGTLRKKYTELKQLQKGGHLMGAIEAQGNLAGLRWGFGQTEHLRKRHSGGLYSMISISHD
jgi:hypothetical protein